MKVLMMCRLYYPHVGGVEKHVEKICEVLGKKHEITIVCEKHDQKLANYEKYKGVRIYRIGSLSKLGIWKWWLSHLDFLKNADVIHIHDVFFWFLPFRFWFWGKKVFMTFHGYEGADAPTWRQIFWHRLAAVLTQGNLCIGDFHKKWYGVKPDFVSYGAV